MATNNQDARANQSRRYNLVRAPHETLDSVRQRALQAAQYYHQNVLNPGHGGDNNPLSDTQANQHINKMASYSPGHQTTTGSNIVNNTDRNHRNLIQGVKMRTNANRYAPEQRNSYNEKLLSRNKTDDSKNMASKPRHILHSPLGSPNTTRRAISGLHKNPRGEPASGERLALYRSNSSIDIDHVDYIELQSNAPGPRHVAGHGNKHYGRKPHDMDPNDSFFDMLQSYQNQDIDQRAPAPPQIKDVLRGMPDMNTANPGTAPPRTENLPNGDASLPANHASSYDQRPQSPSPKEKHKDRKARGKSLTDGTRIMKKLRGTRGDVMDDGIKSNTSVESDSLKPDEILRRKAFVHFDCQSIGLNLASIGSKGSSLQKSRNTTTGASAASSMAHPNTREDVSMDSLEDNDTGDGKSNGLILSCPFFRNEIGGEEERTISLTRATAQRKVQILLGNENIDNNSHMKKPTCNGVSILDTSVGCDGMSVVPVISHNGYIIEYYDRGALYYRNFFYEHEHQNYFGMDDVMGPLAISIKRERVEADDHSDNIVQFQHRIIVRTRELTAIRGCILEDAVPSGKLSSNRGLAHKDVLEYAFPSLPIATLKLAVAGRKTHDQLLKVDEQGLTRTFKVGVMYCRAGQSSEEEMYNNEYPGPAFEEFLDCIGDEVRLNGFNKYRGGLDVKADSTGTHSVYTTFDDYEIMYHVSTLLPFTANNRQQLLRKRHIGNDIVTIVFQEPGAKPFTPKTVRSHFQHVFILVQAVNPCTDHTHYSVAVTRSKDVPPFGPPIPKGATFRKSSDFANFLKAKVINAENASHVSEKFVAMATRTRQEYLKDLAVNSVTNTFLDSGSKLSKFALGSGRKKEKVRQKVVPDVYAKGAVIWHVQVDDFGASGTVGCYLGIAADLLVLIDDRTCDVIFTIPCKSVIGWTSHTNSLRLFYDQGECVLIKSENVDVDDIQEIVHRLSIVSHGCETSEMTLRRNGLGQLGFHVQFEGVVSDVEAYGFAWQAGLRQNSRLVEICKVATATLTHEQMVDLLRTSLTVKVVVIPPLEDGRTRRGEVPLSMQTTGHVETDHTSVASHNRKQFSGTKHWSLDIDKGHHTSLHPTSSTPLHKASDTDSGIHTLQSVHNYNAHSGTAPEGKHSPSGYPVVNKKRDSPVMNHKGYTPHSPVLAAKKNIASSPSISSQSNLSQVSDFSSLSSGSSYSRSRLQEERRSRNEDSKNRPAEAFTDHGSGDKKGKGAPPPYNSANLGSPPIYRGHNHKLSQMANLEPTHLRNVTSTTGHYKSMGAINKNDTTPTKSSLRNTSSKLTRLQRTLSDESLHASRELFHPHVSQPVDLGQSFNDVIFTTAIPIQVRDAKDQHIDRLSPRAIISSKKQVLPSSKISNVDKRMPLPDEQRLDWSHLLQTADKALSDKKDRHTENKDRYQVTDTNILENRSDYVQELEAKCLRLQQNLDKERKERQVLENEVNQLKQDNVRLQGESQTAAAQLRKFTEWFFNTIDRQ